MTMKAAFQSMMAVALMSLTAALPLQSGATSLRPAYPKLDVSVTDQDTQAILPIYHHRGHSYIAGEPGHRYTLRLANPSSDRLLAVVSIDGVNVISGETASTQQTGYVIEPHSETRIDGWRKNMNEAAEFYFSTLSDSYAARTGRPSQVGIIGVAVFRERTYPIPEPEVCCAQNQAPQATRGPATRGMNDRDASGQGMDSARETSAPQAKAQRMEGPIGTGHGQRVDSRVSRTTFERASKTPDYIVALEYDTRQRLIARGILPRPVPYRESNLTPFPGDFVPDPPPHRPYQ